jgi:type II secretory pathway pseudopilin PulG
MAVTPVEAAVGLSIFGSIAAVAIPAFSSNVHASRLTEATSGVEKISANAVAQAEEKSIADAFPPRVQLTPIGVPRGHAEIDPPGTWDAPTWRALDFRASPDGVAHWFSFGFDSSGSATVSSFVAHAHGDQDGDGLTSTFEARGHDDAQGAVVEPGMYVDKEIE